MSFQVKTPREDSGLPGETKSPSPEELDEVESRGIFT